MTEGETVGNLQLMGGSPLLPVQYQALISQANTRVILGAYGSGKSQAGALCLLHRAFETGYTEDYLDDNPTSLIIGPTAKVLKDSSYRSVKTVCPPELIRKEWVSPGEWRILLDNGHMLLFRSWSGSIEGLNVAGTIWLDECHLLDDAHAFTNFVARGRDPKARQLPLVVLTGIPVFGWLREYWGPGNNYPDCDVFHASTFDNHYLKPEVIARIKASCSAKDAETYLMGKWAHLEGALFFEFDPEANITQKSGDPAKPCHLAIDPGERGAVLWAQQHEDQSIHIVDEYLPNSLSIATIMDEVRARKWRLHPSVSRVYVDPTTGRDVLNLIEKSVPQGVAVIRRSQKADERRAVEYGVRCVNSALRDGAGKIKLTIYAGLPRTERSLITALNVMRRDERSGHVHKDNKTDHIADCLRYLVTDLLPLKDSGIQVC